MDSFHNRDDALKQHPRAQVYVRREMPAVFDHNSERFSQSSSKYNWTNFRGQRRVSPNIENPPQKCLIRQPLYLLSLIIMLGLGLAVGLGLTIAHALALTTIKTTVTTVTTTSITTSTTTSVTTTTTSVTSTSTTSTTSTTSSTTSTTSTTVTPTPSCNSPSASGRIFSFDSGTAPIIYTSYSYGFIANDSSATIVFAMSGDDGPGHHYWLLDTVSFMQVNTSTNILINGGFETGDLTGWTQYCATDANCGIDVYGQLTNTTCDSGTYCYIDKCHSGGHFDYLIQSVNTIVSYYYVLTFELRAFANGGHHLAYVMLL